MPKFLAKKKEEEPSQPSTVSKKYNVPNFLDKQKKNKNGEKGSASQTPRQETLEQKKENPYLNSNSKAEKEKEIK